PARDSTPRAGSCRGVRSVPNSHPGGAHDAAGRRSRDSPRRGWLVGFGPRLQVPSRRLCLAAEAHRVAGRLHGRAGAGRALGGVRVDSKGSGGGDSPRRSESRCPLQPLPLHGPRDGGQRAVARHLRSSLPPDLSLVDRTTPGNGLGGGGPDRTRGDRSDSRSLRAWIRPAVGPDPGPAHADAARQVQCLSHPTPYLRGERMPDKELGAGTQAVWGGESRARHGDFTQVPVVHSVSYGYDDVDHWMSVALHEQTGHIYGRNANPTVAVFEEKIRLLEGGEAATAGATGMASISNTLFALLAPGKRVVSVKDTYGGTNQVFAEYLPQYGVEVALSDTSDHDAIEAEVGRGCDLLYLETPTNPTLKVLDLERLSRAGHD